MMRYEGMDAKRKNLIIAFTLTFIGVLTFLVFKSQYHPEPVYNGKPLSAWAKQYGSNHWSGRDRAADKEAEFAIRQIGTNGIPFLLDLMRAKDSAMKKKLRTALPRTWQARLHLDDNTGETRRVGAHGLAALGTNAPSAVPALIEIATHHPDEDGRYIAAFALRTLGAAAEPAIPFFIQCLTNKDVTIRDEAAMGLGIIHQQPEIVVPALIEYLKVMKADNNHGWAVNDAIYALGRFETNAKPALPLLLSLLNDPERGIREAVTNSLPMIDAEAAAKAQVKRR